MKCLATAALAAWVGLAGQSSAALVLFHVLVDGTVSGQVGIDESLLVPNTFVPMTDTSISSTWRPMPA